MGPAHDQHSLACHRARAGKSRWRQQRHGRATCNRCPPAQTAGADTKSSNSAEEGQEQGLAHSNWVSVSRAGLAAVIKREKKRCSHVRLATRALLLFVCKKKQSHPPLAHIYLRQHYPAAAALLPTRRCSSARWRSRLARRFSSNSGLEARTSASSCASQATRSAESRGASACASPSSASASATASKVPTRPSCESWAVRSQRPGVRRQ